MAKQYLIDTGNPVRDKLLSTACGLFYNLGIRAVGVDHVVAKAEVAKTSLYRYFKTKDDLVCAYLEYMSESYWRGWDEAIASCSGEPRAELYAILAWIGKRCGDPEYRGCPQVNVVAEYCERDHPAIQIANGHKRELRRRFTALAEGLGAPNPSILGGQLTMLAHGAIVGAPIVEDPDLPALLLKKGADALLSFAGR